MSDDTPPPRSARGVAGGGAQIALEKVAIVGGRIEIDDARAIARSSRP